MGKYGSFEGTLHPVHIRMRDTSVSANRRELAAIEAEGILGTGHRKSKLTTQLPALAGAARERAYLWRRRAATVAAGALTLVMAYGVVFGHNGLTAFAHKREEAKVLQQQMQQLQKENDRLREHVDRLQNDPSAIEHEAREELHYTRAGEVIYTIPDAGANSTPQESSAASAPKP